ncbi:MAG: M20/M25/M40 family metallo-hydrolase, partial [Clostridia bacterium]|nr:M20/M25/M40 family metallo-hydrolase [Clostridia bacterium]
KDHELVETLLKVYAKHTGDNDSEPIVIGGGTYARAIENAVAFGPVFDGQAALEHQKNEYIEIDLLLKASVIFADAMYELAK